MSDDNSPIFISVPKLLKDITDNLHVNTASKEYLDIYFDLCKIIKKVKCECGKEKHGFAKHSTWCDVKE